MLTTALDSYWTHRFAWLFFSLLLTLAGRPILESLVSGFNPLGPLLAVNLVAAIASTAHERWIRILLLVGIAFLVARGIRAVLGVPPLLATSEAVWVVVCLLATSATARHALGVGVVDSER